MTDKCISISDISFSYDRHRKIYDSFSLDILENEIFFIMGTNGCGKTTLLKIIASFLETDSGSVYIGSKQIGTYDKNSLSKLLAYVPQTIHLNSDFLVKDYLALGRTPYMGIFDSVSVDAYRIVERYAVEMGVESLLNVEFNTLSGGQKQNVAICRALIQETPIIIMDEPMSALDIGKQADFLNLLKNLRESGKTVVLTSHNPNHAFAINGACKVCLLHNGKILGLGNCDEVLTQENINTVYGDRILVDKERHLVMFGP